MHTTAPARPRFALRVAADKAAAPIVIRTVVTHPHRIHMRRPLRTVLEHTSMAVFAVDFVLVTTHYFFPALGVWHAWTHLRDFCNAYAASAGGAVLYLEGRGR